MKSFYLENCNSNMMKLGFIEFILDFKALYATFITKLLMYSFFKRENVIYQLPDTSFFFSFFVLEYLKTVWMLFPNSS